MELGHPFIRIKLDTSEPIELSEFVGAFTAVSAEYDRFIRTEKPDADPNATLFVKEVRAGCIEADLVPWALGTLAAAMPIFQNANTIAEFVERYGGILGAYLPKGGKVADASVTKLKDFSDQVSAIASSPNSSLEIAAIEIIDGEKVSKAAFKFDTSQARDIKQHVEDHIREMEHKTDAVHQRVLMVFTRSDVGKSTLGKRSGELVRIDSIVEGRSLALIYAADLAEQKIKHEISEAEDNVFKKGFVVDVNVEIRAGKPIAYRVMHLHQVIDLPDD